MKSSGCKVLCQNSFGKEIHSLKQINRVGVVWHEGKNIIQPTWPRIAILFPFFIVADPTFQQWVKRREIHHAQLST